MPHDPVREFTLALSNQSPSPYSLAESLVHEGLAAKQIESPS